MITEGKIQRKEGEVCRDVIRVRKEDSVWVYFMLEAQEGLTSYSTLPFDMGDPDRCLELWTSPSQLVDLDWILATLPLLGRSERAWRLSSQNEKPQCLSSS